MCDLSPEDTVTSRLQYWSVTSPETPAFVYVTPEGERYAYSRQDLFSLSRRSASWLRKKNVSKGDVVLSLVPTSPEQTLIAMGTALLGATAICSYIQYKDGADILPLMNTGDVTALVVDQTDQQAISALGNFIPNFSPGSVTARDIPSLKTVIFCNRFADDQVLTFLETLRCEEEADLSDLSPDDVTTIFATSGTSGQTKLLPVSHRHVMKLGLHICETHGCEADEIIFNACSFSWTVGYPSDYLVAGYTRVVPYVKRSPPRDPEKFVFNLLKQERVTQAFMTPVFLKAMLGRADLLVTDDRWRARSILMSGCVIRKDMATAWENLTSELRVIYGSTEMAAITYKTYIDAVEVEFQVEEGNCGKPAKGRSVKVVDKALREVPPNTRGELMIENKGWFPGYLKQPLLTAEAVPEVGWFRSGDLGYVNEHGDVFVEGRYSDVISVGSFLFYPQLLESHIMRHPGVQDVAVVAIPDKDFENLPCVCVVQDPRPEAPRLVPDNLILYCTEYFQESFLREDREQEYTTPKLCLVFDKFPVNGNGKVLRKVLRNLALERLGLHKNC